MTIHTQWMTILRQDASDAFTHAPQSPVHASFIDGQIKLMKSDAIQTWSHFLYSQFSSVIMRHFREYGCRTVVLAFDDKKHVPRAKAITQLKRRAGVNIIEFHENDTLPDTIPDWKEAIMNPHFKHKVIQLIVQNVPRLVDPPQGCKLIVDWEDIDVYEYGEGEPVVTTMTLPHVKVGEADIKFAQWMQHLLCPMLLEATDGDYIPIAMGLKTMDIDHPITILKGYREKDGGLEFIDIDRLHGIIQRTFRRAARGQDPGQWWEIKLFIVLLGFAGTDFTRNLPLVSPNKIWAALPLVIRTFAMENHDHVHIPQGKRLVELLYSETYPKHIDPFSRTSIHEQAQGSKLSERYKALIPTDERIVCTLKNINFLLAYWLHFQPPADITAYGFRIGRTGAVEWDD